jgi:hypothetical protein
VPEWLLRTNRHVRQDRCFLQHPARLPDEILPRRRDEDASGRALENVDPDEILDFPDLRGQRRL